MAELIAVSMFPAFNPDRSLKREALLFDHVELFGLSRLLQIAEQWDGGHYFQEWRVLQESGFLRDPKIGFAVSNDQLRPAGPLPPSPMEVLRSTTPEALERIARTQQRVDVICRDYAGWVRAQGDSDAVYLGESSGMASENTAAKGHVLRVTLRQLPLPDDTTPWEAITDFRRDPDARAKYRRLRHWMNEVAGTNRTAQEIEDELLYRLDEYAEAMKVHRIKTTLGVIETLLISSAEVLGNLASFKWGDAMRTVCGVRKEGIALREAEQQAAGREVAYLIDARKRFT
jgi:hypothetical protein